MPRFLASLLFASLAPAAVAEQPPDVNYKLHCMGCHLADGSGGPPQVPDLRGEMGCMVAVEGGRQYLVQVPGASQAAISDAELAALVNWMLENFSRDTLPADYRPLTAEEVRAWRPGWLSEVTAVRAALMARYPERCRSEGKVLEGGP